ncbi:hypothetical protein E2C01_078254 [Portunus trituberculatus]|uniref:Uncharacterized protein n=1 Tax=Portunus trituberculatus TaxID=210409 RepID=A0A5B7II88_PORTR|nr:hypothetical protein [Portunus trituberculatus]
MEISCSLSSPCSFLLPTPAVHLHDIPPPTFFYPLWQEQKEVFVVSVAAHCTSLPHPSTMAGQHHHHQLAKKVCVCWRE